MTQQQFKQHWKNKNYKATTLKAFNKNQVVAGINQLLKIKDFKRVDYDKKIALVNKIIGDPKKQYKKLIEKEIKEAIKTGNERLKDKRNETKNI